MLQLDASVVRAQLMEPMGRSLLNEKALRSGANVLPTRAKGHLVSPEQHILLFQRFTVSSRARSILPTLAYCAKMGNLLPTSSVMLGLLSSLAKALRRGIVS